MTLVSPSESIVVTSPAIGDSGTSTLAEALGDPDPLGGGVNAATGGVSAAAAQAATNATTSARRAGRGRAWGRWRANV